MAHVLRAACCTCARWWSEYASRKNDEEQEHVADSLLYDERCHLPRCAQQHLCASAPAMVMLSHRTMSHGAAWRTPRPHLRRTTPAPDVVKAAQQKQQSQQEH